MNHPFSFFHHLFTNHHHPTTASTKNTVMDADKSFENNRDSEGECHRMIGRKYLGKNLSFTALKTTSDGVSVARKIGRLNEAFVARTASRGLKSGNVGQGSVREGSRENMVRGGIVQDAVRREIWSGCGDEFVVEFRESTMRENWGRDRSVLVPLMILREVWVGMCILQLYHRLHNLFSFEDASKKMLLLRAFQLLPAMCDRTLEEKEPGNSEV